MRALAVLLALLPVLAAADDLDEAFDSDVLILDTNYACFRFDIYLAITPQQQARGLMHVRELPATTGMLFVDGETRIRSMWMKNTYISLDMVFARADGTITNIVENTEPLSLRSVRSTEPVNFVLELNAGTVARIAMDESSRLIWEPMYDGYQ